MNIIYSLFINQLSCIIPEISGQ